MRIDQRTLTEIETTLSRRNLRSLLAMLDGAPREDPILVFFDPPWPLLIGNAEEDATRYTSRAIPPVACLQRWRRSLTTTIELDSMVRLRGARVIFLTSVRR